MVHEKHTEVRFSLKETEKKTLKNDVKLCWRLHICTNAGTRIFGNAHMKMPMCPSSWSSASFAPSHRLWRGERAVSGTWELPCWIKTAVSRVGMRVSASAVERTWCIMLDLLGSPQQAGVESPAPEKL